MKTYFSIHAGEYLVGSYIESKFKILDVWIPSKDSGIDLLLTNSKKNKSVSVQVKFSKDFLITHIDSNFHKDLAACGWWSLNYNKIKNSKADFWIFVLPKFNTNDVKFVIIRPSELKQVYDVLNRPKNIIQSYIWITNIGKCWETRGLRKKEHLEIVKDTFINPSRNLSKYLNNWNRILNKLR